MGDHYPNTLKVKDQNLRKCLIPEKKIFCYGPGNIRNEEKGG
jgi:hypothetical protein